MPIYEYVCRACGAELEKMQRFSEAPLRDCPRCGETTLSKKISAGSFRLKGGGWYVTDFRDKKSKGGGEKAKDEDSSKKEGKADGESASGGKTKDESKSDSQSGKKETQKQAGAHE